MTCYHPLAAYRIKGKTTDNGKSVITFSLGAIQREYGSLEQRKVFVDDITLPCGKCLGCKLDKSREWATRCVHEALCHKDSCFITLTYNDANIPLNGELNTPTLRKRDLQLFWKRLRKKFPDVKIRYYGCGEYGSLHQRPHYHAIIFGFDFMDKQLFKQNNGFNIYTSKLLQELWPFGFSTIAGVSFESAAYVARYCMKKKFGEFADIEYQDKEPEFSSMSLKPGIGYDYYKKYTSDIYERDKVVIRNNLITRPPRYYDKIFDLEYPEAFEVIKEHRVCMAKDNKVVDVAVLHRKETHKRLTIRQLVRPLESEI